MKNLHQVYVGIGSNINRHKHISNGLIQLNEKFEQLHLSSVYMTKAVGFDGDDFYNLAAGFRSPMDATAIEQILKQIERENGRDHQQAKFSARTLEIDLLLFDDLILHQHGIAVPRDEILKYAFVLKPLAEIAGAVIHPETGQSIQSHWDSFDPKEQSMQKLELDFNLN